VFPKLSYPPSSHNTYSEISIFILHTKDLKLFSSLYEYSDAFELRSNLMSSL